MTQTPHYVLLGHITADVQADQTLRAGGTVLYSARAAETLGMTVAVVTAGVPRFAQTALPVPHHVVPSAQTTTFENVYHGDRRTQYLRQRADMLTPQAIPLAWRSAPILHYAPVANEIVLAETDSLHPQLLGLTIQGWLRAWDALGRVRFCEWQPPSHVCQSQCVAVASIEDFAGDWQAVQRLAGQFAQLVITQAAGGATLFQHGVATHLPTQPVTATHPTGAGDVFATALFLHFYQHADLLAATAHAHLVATRHILGQPLSA
jgi:hypothetical protein